MVMTEDKMREIFKCACDAEILADLIGGNGEIRTEMVKRALRVQDYAADMITGLKEGADDQGS